MTTQLQTYIQAHGPDLRLRGRRLTFDGLCQDGDIAVATVRGPRASYTAVLMTKTRVVGAPGAEAWAVMDQRGRDVGRFAVDADRWIELS